MKKETLTKRPAPQHPVQKPNKCWIAAAIGDSHAKDDPLKVEFPNREECQKGCDVFNKFFDYTEEEVQQFLNSLKK